MAEAIQAEHLAYAYPGAEGGPGISVFRDLNLKIEEGTFVAVLGRNGCGKSTLAKHCNAIALPEGGTVTVFGMDTQDEGNLIPIRLHRWHGIPESGQPGCGQCWWRRMWHLPRKIWGCPLRRSGGVWTRPCARWACTSTGSMLPISSPVGKSSGWPLQESLPCGPSALSWTNLRRCWTPGDGKRLWRLSPT